MRYIERCLKTTMQVQGSVPRPYTIGVDGEGKAGRMAGGPGFPYCTCPKWMINRNKSVSIMPGVDGRPWCKHLEQHSHKLCGWQGEPIISGHCDECLGPTEIVKELEDDA